MSKKIGNFLWYSTGFFSCFAVMNFKKVLENFGLSDKHTSTLKKLNLDNNKKCITFFVGYKDQDGILSSDIRYSMIGNDKEKLAQIFKDLLKNEDLLKGNLFLNLIFKTDSTTTLWDHYIQNELNKLKSVGIKISISHDRTPSRRS